jgi:hypothetical protein
MDEDGAGLAGRVADLERRLARVEAAQGQVADGARDQQRAEGRFWALDELKAHAGEPGAVLFAGFVRLPGGERYEWQQGHPVDTLLAGDWAECAAALTALAHPVRLLLLHEILLGVRTTAELSGHERLGTSGQLYHHLRQLVSAGWLRSTARGQYSVPPERVVPLLTVLAAARG